MRPTDPAPFLVLPLAGEADTQRVAARLAPSLRAGDTVLLVGDLGAGKTTLARALIRARLHDPALEVPSPTFTLVQTYGRAPDDLWHADLYRLTGPDEVEELGLTDAFGRALCLVEWPDRLGRLAPADALTAMLAGDGHGGRTLRLSGAGDWPDRVRGALSDA